MCLVTINIELKVIQCSIIMANERSIDAGSYTVVIMCLEHQNVDACNTLSKLQLPPQRLLIPYTSQGILS